MLLKLILILNIHEKLQGKIEHDWIGIVQEIKI